MAKLLIDGNRQNITPTIILRNRNLDNIGALIGVADVNVSVNLNGANELSFTVYKYLDMTPDGSRIIGPVAQVLNPLWHQIESLKVVYVDEYNENFEISVNTVDSECTVKHITGTSLCEAELSNVLLYDIEINTKIDSDNQDYVNGQFIPSVFYKDTDKAHSIVHRILDKVPNYSVGHVDESLANMTRAFSINGTDIYSFLTGDFAKQFECLCLFNSTNRTISFYDLNNRCTNPYCSNKTKKIGTSLKCPYCGSTEIAFGYGKDTSIFITNENIAQEVSMESDTDSLKNCFRVSGGDDDMTATLMNINPNGSQYIYYFNESQYNDMPSELMNKLRGYQSKCDYYAITYPYNKTSLSKYQQNCWDAYNQWVKTYDYKYPDSIVPNTITGYNELALAIYNVSDVYSYLKTSMLPTIVFEPTTAQAEVNKITSSKLGKIGVSTSVKTLDNVSRIILDYAKIFIDTARYKLTISTKQSGYPQLTTNNTKWEGYFSCVSLTDETDVGESKTKITLTLTNDQETFLKQKLQRQLDEYDLKGKTTDPDNSDWTKYSVDALSGYLLAYEGVASVLQTPVDGIASNLQQDFYKKYRDIIEAIEAELQKKSADLKKIGDFYDALLQFRTFTHQVLNFENYLGKTLLNQFYNYRREQEYTNSNYISDGLDSSEIINRAQELLDYAKRNLVQAATLQHTMSVSMNDILAVPEFKPLLEDFDVGNWIRVRVNDEVVRLRLTKYSINFGDILTLNVDFSDIIESAASSSDIQSILAKATSIGGKFDYVENQASSAYKNKSYVDNWFSNGLDATNVKIVNNAKNQTVTLNENGILCREYISETGMYDERQMRLFNQGLYLTDNNWSSLVTAIGKFIYQHPDGKEYQTFGINGQTIVGKLLLGEELIINNPDNTFTIDQHGLSLTSNRVQFKLDTNNPNNFLQVNKKVNGKYETQLGVDVNGNVSMVGNIEAKGGLIGGFTINDYKMYYTTDEIVGMGTSENWAFWAGYSESTKKAAFQVKQNGDLIATNVDLTGKITSTSGSIGGFTIDSGSLYYTANQTVGMGTATNWAFWAGYDISTKKANFQVKQNGDLIAKNVDLIGKITATSGSFMGKVTSSEANITGTVVATSGQIGSDDNGFSIGDDYLQSKDSKVGMGTTANWAFWAGYDKTTEKATFQVKHDGSLIATKGTIGGFTITDNYIQSSDSVVGIGVTTSHAFWAGYNSATNKYTFHVNQAGYVEASNINITGGSINGGTIGGFKIDNTYIQSSDSKVGLGVSDAHAFWAGYDASATNKYPFNVSQAGVLTAIGGGQIGAFKFSAGLLGSNGALYTENKKSIDADVNGVYISTDGIALGKGLFKVTNSGTATISAGVVGGWTITKTQLQNKDGSIKLDSNGTIQAINFIAKDIGDIGRIANTINDYEETTVTIGGKQYTILTKKSA